jgi:hypothetical protein
MPKSFGIVMIFPDVPINCQAFRTWEEDNTKNSGVIGLIATAYRNSCYVLISQSRLMTLLGTKKINCII